MNYGKPWLDGEKIPDDHLRDIFCVPPGIPRALHRSSLITGSKGVGKTTLLRYQEKTHIGISTYISFPNEFASLTKQTGNGPLAQTFEYSDSLCGKATSLLALGITRRLASKGLAIPREAIISCLPSSQHGGRVKGKHVDLEWIETRRSEVARASLDEFEGLADIHPLPPLAAALGKLCTEKSGPLLLLFDRADMVLTPSLVPVFELLDQAGSYISLVAMRPGHTGHLKMGAVEEAIAGDHYDVTILELTLDLTNGSNFS